MQRPTKMDGEQLLLATGSVATVMAIVTAVAYTISGKAPRLVLVVLWIGAAGGSVLTVLEYSDYKTDPIRDVFGPGRPQHSPREDSRRRRRNRVLAAGALTVAALAAAAGMRPWRRNR